MSQEQKDAISQRQKDAWAKRKAEQIAKEAPPDPLQQALARTPLVSDKVAEGLPPEVTLVGKLPLSRTPLVSDRVDVGIDVSGKVYGTDENLVAQVEHFHKSGIINIVVDWDNIPMPEAQQLYAQIQAEFNRAGRILNARSMARYEGYTCFMCHKQFKGNPGFTDLSFISPETGLMVRVDCCGELCVIRYNEKRIEMRIKKNLAQAELERA